MLRPSSRRVVPVPPAPSRHGTPNARSRSGMGARSYTNPDADPRLAPGSAGSHAGVSRTQSRTRRAAAANDAATSGDAPWAAAPGCITSTQRTLGPMAVASRRWSWPPEASPDPPRARFQASTDSRAARPTAMTSRRSLRSAA